MQTILYILQKEFLQIFRNRLMVIIIFIMPLAQLLILSYTATFEIKQIKLHVVDLDRSSYSRELINKLNGSSFYKLINYSFSYNIAEEDLKKGKADQVIIIPQNFERNLFKEKGDKIQIVTNSINANAASLMNAYTVSIIINFNKDIVVESLGLKTPTDLINLNYSFWFNPELDYITYMVPGILVLLITLIGMFLSAMNIVREKEIGTIEQINVTPIKKYQFIIGKLMPFWIIALFDLAFGLIIGKLVFNIPIVGSVGLIFFVASIYLLVVLGIGLFVSTITNTQQQAMFIAWFFMVIFILMSGLFTPIQSMPYWAQVYNKINPIAYFIEIIRMIMLKGSGLPNIKVQLSILFAYAMLTLSFAVWRYKKVS